MRKLVWIAISVVAKKVGGLRIKVKPENGSLVTYDIDINGNSVKLIVDINSPDMIVPVCVNEGCYDPAKSGSFRYCAGESFCYDRQEPQFSCSRTVPSSEWSARDSVNSTHNLIIEGAPVAIKTFEFKESMIIGEKAGAGVPMKGAMDYPKGILGFGPQRTSCRNETWLSAMGVVFFEFNGDEINLISSGSDVGPQTTWTYVYQTVPTNSSMVLGKYAFNMYHPTICGVDILKPVSSQWTAVIDTTVECLILPGFLHDNLRAWKVGSDGVLYFGVNSDTSSAYASINLNDACVQSRSHTDDGSGLTGRNPIVIGYRALQAMGPVKFEAGASYRLSFNADKTPSSTCATVVPHCIGQQVYDQAKNTCANPDCGAYMFSALDEAEKVCKLKPFVPVAFYVTIGILFIGELIVSQLRKKSVAIAQDVCDRSIES
jgi:hypothetical protein